MGIDPVYKSAFVSNDAKYWFRAASVLLKEDQPGTLLVYTPWHMTSVWHSALESLGEEVELKLEPTPMYTCAFVSNDAKYWFRAASELLKEDEPGTLLV